MRITESLAPEFEVPIALTRRLRLGVVAIGVLLSVGCSDKEHVAGPGSLARPNILLLSIDTLRADHLGVYGYARETSPVIDDLARRSIVFDNAFAPTSWTLPSHAALLTGVHPHELGMWSIDSMIPSNAPRLAELLAAAGYQTAALVDSGSYGFVGGERGFSQGFEEYRHAPHRPHPYLYDMAVSTDTALQWFEQRDPSRPFFLFLHTKSVHALPKGTPCLDERCFPYDKPEPFRFRFIADENAPSTWGSPELGLGQAYLLSLNWSFVRGSRDPRAFPDRDVKVLEALYDAGIYYVDEHLGRLLEKMAVMQLLDETAIVVTSDHGEAFLEHNLFMHWEVYREVLRVPLILKLPGVSAGRRVSTRVTLEDLVPTILDLAGLSPPESVTGRALPLQPGGQSASRKHFAYNILTAEPGYYKAFTLFDDAYKLVYHNFGDQTTFRADLYDLRTDPEELHPLAGVDPRGAIVQAELEKRRRSNPLFEPERVADAAEKIRALGYIR